MWLRPVVSPHAGWGFQTGLREFSGCGPCSDGNHTGYNYEVNKNTELSPLTRSGQIGVAVIAVAVLSVLYATSHVNYLLFHGLAEVFSIVIAGGVFFFAWNTREVDDIGGLTNLGIAYLFIALLDTIHTFAYAGMGVFPDYDYYANQVWVVARGIEATALLMYAISVERSKSVGHTQVFVAYGAITTVGLYLIYGAGVFPECFVEGQGQTTFKLIAELVIIAVLAVTAGLLSRNRLKIDSNVYRLMLWSIGLTILGELAFTVYISNYGISNMVGHYAKIVSFYLIYKAIIETGLRSPMSLLFNQLQRRERELQEANDAKARLFSIIAHDLKGPIGAVASFAEIPYEEFVTLDPNEQRQVLTDMHTSAARSLNLLEELMTWARNQTGQIEVRPVEVEAAEVVQDSVEAVLSAADQKGITLHTNDGAGEVSIWADRSMITTVLRNLLSNAIKFTPRGGSVTIEASKEDHTGSVLTVTDTGVGMSESVRDNLFRIDRHTSMHGTENEKGTGFGLILSKELVEKNHGDIHVDSTPGRGTTMRVVLPSRRPGA